MAGKKDRDVIAHSVNVNLRYRAKDGDVFILKSVTYNRYGCVLKFIGYFESTGMWFSLDEFDDESGMDFCEFKLIVE